MTETRIYSIKNSEHTYLVEAATGAQALRFVAKRAYEVSIAKPKDIAALMKAGVTLETATADEEVNAG